MHENLRCNDHIISHADSFLTSEWSFFDESHLAGLFRDKFPFCRLISLLRYVTILTKQSSSVQNTGRRISLSQTCAAVYKFYIYLKTDALIRFIRTGNVANNCRVYWHNKVHYPVYWTSRKWKIWEVGSLNI